MKKIQLLIITIFIVNIANAQWQQTTCPYSNDELVGCFATNGNNIFAGSDNGSVYFSSDLGNSWVAINSGLPGSSVFSLLISGSKIFAGTDGNGIYVSSNNGSNWTSVNSGIPTNISIYNFASNGSEIFAGTETGIYKSSNSGISWAPSNTGIPAGVFAHSIVLNGSTIFAVTDTVVYKSINNGSSWNSVNGVWPPSTNLRYAANCGGNIFVDTEFGDVYKTSDNGDSWTVSNNGITSIELYHFIVSNNYIFIGSIDGVFLSSDLGNSWNNVSDGLTLPFPEFGIYNFGISENYIFGGIYEEGVWRRPLSEMLGFEETKANSTYRFFPNPARDNITIEKLSNTNQNEYIAICDIQGKKILQQQLKQSQTVIDISSLNKGLYIIKLINSEHLELNKFVKK